MLFRTCTFVFILITAMTTANADVNAVTNNAKAMIGPTAVFTVEDGSEFLARIDTGAAQTSINTTAIEVVGESENSQDNIGKTIHFTITDANNQSRQLTSTIARIVTINAPQGREVRYVVPLKLTWNGETRTIGVNLRDRGKLTYKLLVGRNWLNNNAVVDVAASVGNGARSKPTIGETGRFFIHNPADSSGEKPLIFTARIDTGATSTSINASNIIVTQPGKTKLDNLGKQIRFTISNNLGEQRTIDGTIEEVVDILSSTGFEYRYKVRLDIRWLGNDKKQQPLLVNLRDRSHLHYKLLIGRDWIGPNAIVDVSIKE